MTCVKLDLGELEERRLKEVATDAPGVSMILTAYFCCSPVAGDFVSQSQNVAALWIVIPFSRSSSILSIFAPTLSLPLTCTVHISVLAGGPKARKVGRKEGRSTDLMNIAYPASVV
jgi:hypothetical protein